MHSMRGSRCTGLRYLPSDDGDTCQKFRMQFDCVNFQQRLKTLQFQRYEFKV